MLRRLTFIVQISWLQWDDALSKDLIVGVDTADDSAIFETSHK
jgi:hypothetical protein